MSRVVLATGSSRGLEVTIAKPLAKQGHRKIINYNKSKERVESLVASISEK